MLEIVTLWGELAQFFDSAIGIFLFISLYSLWVIILLPGLWPSMLAGVIYGSLIGSIIVFIGASIGALVTFLIGRKFLREWVKMRIASFPKFESIQKSVSKEGLKLVLLTRLSPVFPFSLLNLAYGLSEVSFRDFSIGLIGILPGTLLFCSLGATAGDIAKFTDILSQNRANSSLLTSILGLSATLAVVLLVSRAARNALKEYDN